MDIHDNCYKIGFSSILSFILIFNHIVLLSLEYTYISSLNSAIWHRRNLDQSSLATILERKTKNNPAKDGDYHRHNCQLDVLYWWIFLLCRKTEITKTVSCNMFTSTITTAFKLTVIVNRVNYLFIHSFTLSNFTLCLPWKVGIHSRHIETSV